MPGVDVLRLVPLQVWIVVGVGVVAYVAIAGFLVSPRQRDSGKIAEQARREAGGWATRRELQKKGMLQHRNDTIDPRRHRLGFTLDGRGEKVVSNVMESVAIFAPTRSRKTVSYVVPAILEHVGPQVVTSVKTDVRELTRAWTSRDGRPTWTFDPSQTAGDTCRWSPLATVHSWGDALKATRWLQDSSSVEKKSVEDQGFWDANARKVLAPLLLLAARRGEPINAVVRWAAQIEVLEQQLAAWIEDLNVPDAYDYWVSYQGLVDRTKSSVIATLFTVLEPWGHPDIAQAVDVSIPGPDILRVSELLDREGTLYLIAPVSDQELFTPIFETLVNAILMEVERRAARTGKPLDPPLFLCLDEAANIAPLRRLDKVASVFAGLGLKLMSVWQDESQLESIYGHDRTRAIMANHIYKAYLPGITDSHTLETISRLIGSSTIMRSSSATDSTGRRSSSEQFADVSIAPVSWIRQLPEGEVLVLGRNHAPMHLHLITWYQDDRMRRRIDPQVAAEFDRYYAPPSRTSSLIPTIRKAR